MSVRVMALVWDQDLPTTKKMLLLAIADHADDDGDNAWPSKARLAAKVNVSIEYIRRMLRELESDGWITTERQRGGSLSTPQDRRPNLYRINLARLDSDRGQPQSPPRPQPQSPPRGQRGLALTISDTSTTSGARERAAKRRDPIFDALVDVCGIDAERITSSARGSINRAVRELRQVEASPESIIEAASAYRLKFSGAALTPSGLAKHYPGLITTGSEPAALTGPCGACSGSGYLSDPQQDRVALPCAHCSATGRVLLDAASSTT